jgi:hypothetical protein
MARSIEEIDTERQKVWSEMQQKIRAEEEQGVKFGDRGHYEEYLKSLEQESAEAQEMENSQGMGM